MPSTRRWCAAPCTSRSRRPSDSSRARSALRLVGVSDIKHHAFDDADVLAPSKGSFLAVRKRPSDAIADVAPTLSVRKCNSHHLLIGDSVVVPFIGSAVHDDVERHLMVVSGSVDLPSLWARGCGVHDLLQDLGSAKLCGPESHEVEGQGRTAGSTLLAAGSLNLLCRRKSTFQKFLGAFRKRVRRRHSVKKNCPGTGAWLL